MNQGGACSPAIQPLAQRLIGKGITLEPEQAIGWFNLGIGLHQQRKISGAIKAYQHCLSLPHSTDTGIAARNNLSQDLLLQGEWKQGWTLYNQRFRRNPAITQFLDAFGPAHTAYQVQEPTSIADERTRAGRHLAVRALCLIFAKPRR